MSWAAKREVTREEDESYSLLGIFGVSLPPLYGEGRENAFRRLQIEIMGRSPDHTIFSWHRRFNQGDMLASSTRDFMIPSRYEPVPHHVYLDTFPSQGEPKLDYALTNAGLHIELPMIPIPHRTHLFLAFLACEIFGSNLWTAIVLQRRSYGGVSTGYKRVCLDQRSTLQLKIPGEVNIAGLRRQRVSISGDNQINRPRYSKSGKASPLHYRVRFRPLHSVQYRAPNPSVRAALLRSVVHPLSLWQPAEGTVLIGTEHNPDRGSPSVVLHECQNDVWSQNNKYNKRKLVPISTVAFGTINSVLWVFVGFGVNKNNYPLDEASFKYPAGYAWRRYREFFTFCVEHDFSLSPHSDDDWVFEEGDRDQALWNVRLSDRGTRLDIHIWGDRPAPEAAPIGV